MYIFHFFEYLLLKSPLCDDKKLRRIDNYKAYKQNFLLYCIKFFFFLSLFTTKLVIFNQGNPFELFCISKSYLFIFEIQRMVLIYCDDLIV